MNFLVIYKPEIVFTWFLSGYLILQYNISVLKKKWYKIFPSDNCITLEAKVDELVDFFLLRIDSFVVGERISAKQSPWQLNFVW
jgi:hypothetical protein